MPGHEHAAAASRTRRSARSVTTAGGSRRAAAARRAWRPSPRAAQITCWTPGAHAGSSASAASIDEAEKTMTRPMVSSRPAAPSTRWQLVIGPSSQAGPAEPGRALDRCGAAGARRSAPADRGRVLVVTAAQRPDRVGEGPAAVPVVAEDVHRRRGRGQQHRVPGPGQPRGGRDDRVIVASPVTPVPSIPSSSPLTTVTTGTVGACRAREAAIGARSRPRRTTPARRAATAATSGSTSAPLSSPPAIHTTRG